MNFVSSDFSPTSILAIILVVWRKQKVFGTTLEGRKWLSFFGEVRNGSVQNRDVAFDYTHREGALETEETQEKKGSKKKACVLCSCHPWLRFVPEKNRCRCAKAKSFFA